MVYPTLLPLMRTPRLPVVDWTDAPANLKWTRPFCRKTKSGFCVCAITFQTQSNITTTTTIIIIIITSMLDMLQLAARYTPSHTLYFALWQKCMPEERKTWQKAHLAVIKLYLQYEWQNGYECSGLLRKLDQHLHAVETQRIVLCCGNQLYGTNNYL